MKKKVNQTHQLGTLVITWFFATIFFVSTGQSQQPPPNNCPPPMGSWVMVYTSSESSMYLEGFKKLQSHHEGMLGWIDPMTVLSATVNTGDYQYMGTTKCNPDDPRLKHQSIDLTVCFAAEPTDPVPPQFSRITKKDNGSNGLCMGMQTGSPGDSDPCLWDEK